MVVERFYRGVGSWEISFVFSSERRAVGTGGAGGDLGFRNYHVEATGML